MTPRDRDATRYEISGDQVETGFRRGRRLTGPGHSRSIFLGIHPPHPRELAPGMIWRRRDARWRRFGRQLWAGLALLSYLATALGFPMPLTRTRAAGPAYPCQQGSCGCVSAEECWQHCCCFSPAERHAWARANGVQPPAYAEPEDASGWHSPRQRDLAEPSCTCCAASPKPERPTAKSCCTKSCCDHTSGSTHVSAKKVKVRWIAGLAARRCQGLSTVWTTVGAVLPPPPVASWNPCLRPTDHLVDIDGIALLPPRVPPDPPPRARQV